MKMRLTMKRVKFQIGVTGIILTSMLVIAPFASVSSQVPPAPQLYISRFKVSSGSQYIEIHNLGDEPVDMSKVQLVYYNNYDISKATSSKLVSLSGELARNGYYLVNDSSLTLCYQMTVASASLDFSSTAGMTQLIYLSQSEIGGQFISQELDSAAWSKSAVAEPTDVQKLPTTKPDSFLERQGNHFDQVWAERWPSAADPCQFESSLGEVKSDDTYTFMTGELPPVRYVAAVSENDGVVNRNVGKAAPIINEVLPNPASPQTDADDEFIEIYNPNDTTFDLTGFKLAFGSTNPRKYTIPEGTVINAKEFKTFNSGETSISLSNSLGQIWLLDPNEKIIGTSEPYKDAKDGQVWVLNSGKWLWSLQPTPGSMNAIALAIESSEKGKTAAATLGINSTGSTSSGTPADTTQDKAKLDDAAPLHPGVLAVVGSGALAYTLYEYRHDMSNQLFRTRRYLRNRQTLRKQV
jgi:hypothetical protein